MGEMADYYAELAWDDTYDDQDFNQNDGREDSPIPLEILDKEIKEPFPMLKKTKKPEKPKRKSKTIQDYAIASIDARPKLVHCGSHLIDPNDVVCITKVQKHKGLYIVKLRSNPNPEYPIWVNELDITPLIKQFNVITSE